MLTVTNWRISYIYTSCAVSCAVDCVALIIYSLFNFIPRIFAILKTTTGRTLRLRLKIDFDTDFTPNITRHSCIISAELVVSSYINNLVRLSSIVPFHIIYQVNLHWRNNSAHKYNYYETFFHTLAFHTNFSRIFHPCKLVPQIHVSHFQSPLLYHTRVPAARNNSRITPTVAGIRKIYDVHLMNVV